MEFNLNGEYINSIDNGDVNYLKLESSLSLFIPLNFIRIQATLALRSGISTNVGDYSFFQSNFLSGYENFRGVRRNRFGGRTSQYNNVEFRTNLFEVPNYVLPFSLGFLAHFDAARIWGGSIDDWQTSFGGGLYFSTLDLFMLTGTYSYSVSQQGGLFVLGSKFLF